jgi:hypothetical protein
MPREQMPGVNLRMPREFIDWLLDRAAENGTTLSVEVRSCVAAAIVRSGDAKRYGIDVAELGDGVHPF